MLTVGKWVVDPTRWLNEILTLFTLLWARWFDRGHVEKPVYRGSSLATGDTLTFPVQLAAALGTNEALILQKFHEWIEYNQWAQKQDHFKDGRWWTYNTYAAWQEKHFSWLSVSCIKRICRKLEDAGILVTGRYSKSPTDRTKWYSIDYQKLSIVLSCHGIKRVPSTAQSDLLDGSNESVDSNKKSSKPSISKKPKTKQQHQTPRAPAVVDDVSTASTGEHLLGETEGADTTSTFEGNAHETDAPEREPSPSSAAPLPEMVQVLVNAPHYLNDVVARAYLEKHGVEYCERVAAKALKGTNPPGLWRDLLDKGAYKHVPDQPASVQGKRDDWIIK